SHEVRLVSVPAGFKASAFSDISPYDSPRGAESHSECPRLYGAPQPKGAEKIFERSGDMAEATSAFNKRSHIVTGSRRPSLAAGSSAIVGREFRSSISTCLVIDSR